MRRRRGGGRGRAPSELPVDVAKEVDALEPPVTEQLGVERRHDQVALGALCELTEQRGIMRGMAMAPGARDVRVVRLLQPEIEIRVGHPPELESAGKANLV